MIKVNEAVIVEGKYDKIKLSNFIDGLIIQTNGFSIFKDKEKMKFIRRLANERGLIVITDSDHSGFMIRNYIGSSVKSDKIKNIYIPDVYGKERRKRERSKEGKLGVEGINDEVLKSLFKKAGVESVESSKLIDNMVTEFDLFDCGLSGTPGCKEKKKKLLAALSLPEFLSTSALISYINSSMTRDEFLNYMSTI